MSKTMKLDVEECDQLQLGVHDEYQTVINTLEDVDRWHITYQLVVKRLSDGTFWRTYYTEGATEYQDHAPFENDDCVFTQVEPVQVTVTQYKEIK